MSQPSARADMEGQEFLLKVGVAHIPLVQANREKEV